MRGEHLQTLVLINKNGDSASYRFHKLWRESIKDQLILELKKENEIHRFQVAENEEGITNLIDNKGENYRILGLSYSLSTIAHKEEYKFQIANSFHQSLDLIGFIE